MRNLGQRLSMLSLFFFNKKNVPKIVNSSSGDVLNTNTLCFQLKYKVVQDGPIKTKHYLKYNFETSTTSLKLLGGVRCST